MKKSKTQKGITLIALIITIVVLLILAVVAIRAVQGDGIIQYAQNAKTEYQQGQDEEKEQITDYLEKIEDSVGPWLQTGTIVRNTETGMELNVGDYINYDPITGVDEEKLTYATDSNITGYNSRKFTVNENMKWQVLGEENGKILLLSDNSIYVKWTQEGGGPYVLQLDGKNAFVYGPSIMNEICEIYGYGSGAVGARALDIKDINKLVGYKPSEAVWAKNELYEYGTSVTVTLKQDDAGNKYVEYVGTNGKKGTNTEYTKFEYYDSQSNSFKELAVNESVTVKNNYHGYSISDYISTDSVEYKMLTKKYNDFVATNPSWNYRKTLLLPSQCAIVSDGRAYYRLQVVNMENCKVGCLTAAYSEGKETENLAGILRAVVKLENNVVLEKQTDGTYNIK